MSNTSVGASVSFPSFPVKYVTVDVAGWTKIPDVSRHASSLSQCRPGDLFPVCTHHSAPLVPSSNASAPTSLVCVRKTAAASASSAHRGCAMSSHATQNVDEGHIGESTTAASATSALMCFDGTKSRYARNPNSMSW